MLVVWKISSGRRTSIKHRLYVSILGMFHFIHVQIMFHVQIEPPIFGQDIEQKNISVSKPCVLFEALNQSPISIIAFIPKMSAT